MKYTLSIIFLFASLSANAFQLTFDTLQIETKVKKTTTFYTSALLHKQQGKLKKGTVIIVHQYWNHGAWSITEKNTGIKGAILDMDITKFDNYKSIKSQFLSHAWPLNQLPKEEHIKIDTTGYIPRQFK